MDELIRKLTPEQAPEVVRRLSEREGDIGEAVIREAESVLVAVDLDEIAEEVLFALDLIDVQDLWDRSGSSRDGYTSPDEAAAEIMEEELQPFFDQARRYHELGMFDQEKIYCMGVVLGIYRYEQESKSEFREQSADIPGECAGYLLDEWRERSQDSSAAEAIDGFIRQSCPKWAR